MSYPIAVLSSDTHLSRIVWGKHRDLVGDSAYGLSQVIDHALQYRVPLVLCGDVLDESELESPYELGILFREFSRLEKSGCPLYFICGNHERTSHGAWLSLSSWAKHVHGKTFPLNGRNCFGLDQAPSDQLPAYFTQIPVGTEVLFTHFSWRHPAWLGRKFGAASFEDVPHVEVICSGDLHQHRRDVVTVSDSATSRQVLCLSPGATHLRSITEPRKHFVFLLFDDLTVQSLPLKSREVFDGLARTADELEFLLEHLPTPAVDETLPEEIRRPILAVRARRDTPGIHKRLPEACEGRYHLMIRWETEEEVVAVARVADAAETAARGLLGNLDKVLAPGTKEYELAGRLLSCQRDPEEEVVEVEKSFLSV